MMNSFRVLLLLGTFACVYCQKPEGFELPPTPSYVILTPQNVRPEQILQTSVSILRLMFEQLTIRLMIKMNNTEYANSVEIFKTPGTRIMSLKVPRNTVEGKYYIHVEGSIYPNSAIIFSNRSEINYLNRQITMFIQTSKPVYHQGQTVRFRVIPVQANLMPVYGTLTSIEVLDATGTLVRRWLNPMTNVGGIVELQFELSDQLSEGTWHIRARHEKFSKSKSFEVMEYWEPRFDVNVTMPTRLSVNGFGVYGLIQANHTSGFPVKGNATINVSLRNPTKNRFTTKADVTIKLDVPVFEGKSDFLVTMDELRNLFGKDVKNMEVWINVTVVDWFLQITMDGFAYSHIYPADPQIKFMGGQVRPYKPGMYFTVFLVVYQPDGSKVFQTTNRRVNLKARCETENLPEFNQNSLPIPDDGIVTYTFKPSEETICQSYQIRAELLDEGNRKVHDVEQFIFPYHSESHSYIQVTSTTLHPRVNEYMVFHVTTNYPTKKIFYQVAAGGNIVYTDKLVMPNDVLSRTFSVAISRDMAPIARLIAFFVKQNGEIVADSLAFFANITHLNNVNVQFNRGKDLNVDTIEVNGYAKPGSFIAFSAIHYDLFLHGGASILQDFDLIDELKTYEETSQNPFEHTWYHDEEYIQRVYTPSPSYGADTNTTFNSSGLLLFTDANFTKVNFYHTCNKTEREDRAYPCFTRPDDCYATWEKCDGVKKCVSRVDEMNCPNKTTDNLNIPTRKDIFSKFNRLYRHWDDGGWMWKSFFVKPDGRIDFRVPLPKVDTSWVVGVFSVDRTNGLSIMTHPAKFSGVRRFFITVEMPEESIWGEQIGVRVAIFNYWNYWAESLLEVKRSSTYRVIRMGFVKNWQGAINSYDPSTITDKSVQTLVYLEAGEARYIFIPIVPNNPGNTTINICAYTFIGSNCESRTVHVKMNGVTNYYHTSKFIDLTSSSSLETNNFKIIVQQMFIIPEQRQHRYVPGSQKAAISVVGDVIGPSLGKTLKFATTESVLRLPHGSAENVMFELGYNLQLLLYQRAAGYLPNDVRNDALEYCNLVIQQGLSFYNSKLGAFANFRESLDVPSIFATAMGIWNMLETRISEYDHFIFAPNELFVNTIKYLQTRQTKRGNNTDIRLVGSFEPQEVLDRRFITPTAKKDANGDLVLEDAYRRLPITALVALALSASNPPPSGEAKQRGDDILTKAGNFLQQHVLQVSDVFAKTIATYALQSSRKYSGASDVIQRALNQLKTVGQVKNEFYLADYPIPSPKAELNQAGTLIENPRFEWPNDGYGIASTAMYFSMMLIRAEWKSGSAAANSAVKWLANMRNHNAGFASTFDSLMAINALKNYALADKNRALYRMQIQEQVTSMSTFKRVVDIHRSNYSTQSIHYIPTEKVWGEVTMNTEGTGRCLLQLDVSMNVEYEEKLKEPKSPDDSLTTMPSFGITCTPEFSGRNNSIMVMEACAHWVGNTGVLPFPESGMAVYEIDLPTGYVSLNDELRRYVESKQIPNLRYARFRPRKIYFYFDKISTKPTCVKFRSDRYFPVANVTVEHRCSVYEYYEPGRYNISLYRVKSLNTMNVCNVCGSYQCPYCPNYNRAKALMRASFPLVFFAILLTLARYFRMPGVPRSFFILGCT